MSKVFGIGFHKTGTTSLAVALERLGLRTCDGAAALRETIGESRLMRMLHEHRLEAIFDIAERYDACTDMPWFMLYRELDRRFPGSKFILTARDESRWLQSASRYFGRSESSFRKWIYGSGSPIGHESQWLARYRAHYAEVQSYFDGRAGDILIVDWERGGGWSELAGFLGRAAPPEPFPHLTKTRRAMPDLTGAILVLTHPRTGSSLLMQTLALLGTSVLGSVHRDGTPDAMNPKGYFEHPGVLVDGLNAQAVRDNPDLLRGRAVKLSLHPLVRRRLDSEWAAIASSDAAVLLPIRAPAESIVSAQGLLDTRETPARRARFVRDSARDYLIELGYLAERVCAPGFTRPAPACIDYALAIEDPPAYVETVARAAGLRPSPGQIAGAIANIDRALYRRGGDDAGVRDAAKGFAPLDALYQTLRSGDPLRWARVRQMLPPWVFLSDPA